MLRRLRRLPAYLLSLLAPLAMAAVAANEPVFRVKPGEILVYRVYIAGLALGEQRLTVQAAPEHGQTCLLIETSLDSYPSFLRLLDYHEHRRLWWDAELGIPLREEGQVTQRRTVSAESMVFDLSRGLAKIEKSKSDDLTRQAMVPFVLGTQTGSSLLYHLRTFPWERGVYRLALLGNGGTIWYQYGVEVEKRAIKVPFGTFEGAYHLFNKELKYEVWFDRGPGHLPLEIRSRSGVGTAQAKLVSAEGYK